MTTHTLTYTLEQGPNGHLVAQCKLSTGEEWKHVISGRPHNPDKAADCAHVCDILERDATKRVEAAVTVDPPTESDRASMAKAFTTMTEMYHEYHGNDPSELPFHDDV